MPQGVILTETNGATAIGRAFVEELLQKLFPICRSITGEGLRATLRLLGEQIPLELIEVPSGTPVFDWEIPNEWNIRDAFIKNSAGVRVVDFRKSNLHVVSYSAPVHRRMTLSELRPHLHTLPSQPEAIPYLTTYYEPTWGFCLTHRQYQSLPEGEYEVCIDSSLRPGSLTLAEAVLPGETDREVLLSTYCCHPSMANNELSGPVVTTLLYRHLAAQEHRHYTYRFYFGPETIGALAYLSIRGEHLRAHLDAGFVVTCCGDRGGLTYKQPRNPKNRLDPAVDHVLRHSGVPCTVIPFFPTGSDERQYCAPGFDLPVGSLMRSMYATYPEYHTSLDDLGFVSVDSLLETFEIYTKVLYTLEHDRGYVNLKPFGEPFLKKYGLYGGALGGQREQDQHVRLMRYVLSFSDGHKRLLEIAEYLGCPIWELERAVQDLLRVGLIRRGDDHEGANRR